MNSDTQLTDESFVESLGWEKAEYSGNYIGFIHKNYSIVNDGYFIIMKTYGFDDVKIIEDDGDENKIFEGSIKYQYDLIYLMKLLHYDFKLVKNEERII